MAQYTVWLNDQLVASFNQFSDACDLRENLQWRFPTARVTITNA